MCETILICSPEEALHLCRVKFVIKRRKKLRKSLSPCNISIISFKIVYPNNSEMITYIIKNHIHRNKIPFQFIHKNAKWPVPRVFIYRVLEVFSHCVWISVPDDNTMLLLRTEQSICS